MHIAAATATVVAYGCGPSSVLLRSVRSPYRFLWRFFVSVVTKMPDFAVAFIKNCNAICRDFFFFFFPEN